MLYRRLPTVAWLLIVATACRGGDNPASPGQETGTGGSVPNHGTVTAIVDGVAYSGIARQPTTTSGILFVTSDTSALTVTITFIAPATVGTVTTDFHPMGSVVFHLTTRMGMVTTGTWSALLTQGSGTLTVASFSATGASGTFSFTALPTGAGATGSKVVTNGAFNVTF